MAEQIIIDGIDVSECEFLKYDHIGCDIDETYCFACDCHFKQLKRKTQECEENEKFYLTKYANKDSYCLELEHELNKYKQTFDEIERFMIYEFSGQNQWVKKNVLDIINKAKEQ